MNANNNRNRDTSRPTLGASGLWNLGGAAASGGSGAIAFASGPTPGTTAEDASNAGYPEWMVHEDYALLQAVQVGNHDDYHYVHSFYEGLVFMTTETN